MSNMSYCRFRNTLLDLQDCFDNIDDMDLSQEEERARKRLIAVCKNIVDATEDEQEPEWEGEDE